MKIEHAQRTAPLMVVFSGRRVLRSSRPPCRAVMKSDHSRGDRRGLHTVVLEPYGYRWFRIGSLDYLLERTEIDAS